MIHFPKSHQILKIKIALVLTSLISGLASGQEDVERFNLFTNCAPVRLAVYVQNRNRESAIKSTKEAIESAVESRLRSARIYEKRKTGNYMLIVNLIVLPAVSRSGFRSGVAFSLDFSFHKDLFDPASGLETSAATWDTNILAIEGERPTEAILAVVRTLMDQFVVDYLRVNEQACGKEK